MILRLFAVTVLQSIRHLSVFSTPDCEKNQECSNENDDDPNNLPSEPMRHDLAKQENTSNQKEDQPKYKKRYSDSNGDQQFCSSANYFVEVAPER